MPERDRTEMTLAPAIETIATVEADASGAIALADLGLLLISP